MYILIFFNIPRNPWLWVTLNNTCDNSISFIRDLFRSESEFIPLHAPNFMGNERKYINECIDSTFVSSVGKFVDKFEFEITSYTGSK